MKKIGFLLTAALMLGMASCAEDETSLGISQTNPELPKIEANAISVRVSDALAAGQVDLKDYSSTGLVPAITIPELSTLAEQLNADVTPSFVMEVSANENYDNAVSIDLTATDNGLYAAPVTEWDNAFRGLLGKAPFARTNYIRFAAYVNVNGQQIRVGGQGMYYGQHAVTVTPIDLNIQVEDRYYLVGTINGWNLATAVPFTHSDVNVYDDPVFSLTIEISGAEAEAGWWWKIVPGSLFDAQSWDGLYGTLVDGDTATEGVLYAGGQAGMLTTAGRQNFTIDMLNCTYSVTLAVEQLWTPGQANGWNIDASSILTTSDYIHYTGFMPITGEFLLTPANNWDNKYALGQDGAGTLEYNASSNLPMPSTGAGMYWMDVNLPALTYNTTLIESISMIGDFNGWGGDVDMTPNDNFTIWTATLDLPSDGGWKFRMNHDWALNLGGDLDDLSLNGANISNTAGTYTVTLNLTTTPYTATVVAK